MRGSDDWELLSQVWNGLVSGATISSEIAARWSGYAKKANLPLTFDEQGIATVTQDE